MNRKGIDYSFFIEFIAYLDKMRLKKRSQYRYVYYLSKFPPEILLNLKTKDAAKALNKFIDEQEVDKFSFKNNIFGVVSALKKWLKFTGYPELGIFLDCPEVKRRRNIDILYPGEFISELINAADNDRDKLAICLAAFVGLRINEILQMKPDWINNKLYKINIPKAVAKGGVAYSVNIDENLCDYLLDYISQKGISKKTLIFDYRVAKDSLPKKSEFFGKELELHWKICHVDRLFTSLCKKARLTPIGPHKLRHHLANLMRSKGAESEDVMLQLGHKDIATTFIYSAPSQQKAKEAYEKTMSSLWRFE